MNNEFSYEEDIKEFVKTPSGKADELLQQNNLTVIYIGRETCPYCRRFAKKLASISNEHNTTIYYVNSASPNDSDISSFRQKYNIATVPGFIVKKNGNITVNCDSSMPESEILTLITI